MRPLGFALATRAHPLFGRASRTRREHAEATAADDVHGVANLAQPHDVIAVVEPDYLEPGSQLGQRYAVETSKQEILSQQVAVLLDQAVRTARGVGCHVPQVWNRRASRTT
jgi:hypothetical protein